MTKTFADMTAEEQDKCVGMWCEFVDFDDGDGYEYSTGSSRPKLGIITGREGDWEHQVIHLKHGLFIIPDYDITPRFDLPRAWTPDSDPVPGEWHDDDGMNSLRRFVADWEPKPNPETEPRRVNGMVNEYV